ncbi:MAG: hypothetical protein GTO45_14270 [Candidatus Aminicenantes bacterium]|nr:hypothetical protein [Candidatus Aminicenantes bacterium]NIM79931.1 hypothetical protein [Candidatus Aminicenantes bacterium]NIN19270.1 hypothetical protein [Candidatus Aminicenantes bacterium]NIN43173.1 hypothetical protein [Candidatus Aminicenantes bacterium]NIN85912.1 hypothetical protein [Candidatus Aminicenantes bacterium]
MRLKKKTTFLFLPGVMLFLLVIFLGNCKIKSDGTVKVFSISPGNVLSNMPFTLMVEGTGFKSGSSVIVFNNIEMETRFVNSNVLTCGVEARDTALSPASSTVIVPVYVKNNTSSTPEKSNEFQLTINHRPGFNEPVSIYNGSSHGYQDSTVKIIVNEHPRLYVTWREGQYSSYDSGYPMKLSISEDSGQTWGEAKEIPVLGLFFARDEKLYGLGESNGIITFYKSSDLGDSWASTDVVLPDPNNSFNGYVAVLDGESADNLILVHGKTDDAGYITLSTLQSPDYGETWEIISENIFLTYYFNYKLDWLLLNNNRAVCVGYYFQYGRYPMNRCFISKDGGVTYEDVDFGFDWFHTGILTDQGTLYVLYNNMYLPYMYKLTFYKGSEFGNTTLMRFEIQDHYSAADMVMDAYGNLYIAWDNKMIRSIDDGENWTETAFFSSLENAYSPSLAMDNHSVIYVCWCEDNTIYFTTVKHQ